MALFADTALLPSGWARDVRVTIDDDGLIGPVVAGAAPEPGDERLTGRVLLPALANLHSHAFQRAMAGLTEFRAGADDDFWSWRSLMYRFLDRLTPEHIEAIAAGVYVEMLEAGYTAVGEFHYLHHRPGGGSYDDIAETSRRILAAARATGIGLTHLPALYAQGGADGAPLAGGQLRFGCDLDRFLALVEGVRAAMKDAPSDNRLGVAPHSLRAVSPQLLAEVTAACPEGPIHIHAAEQTREVAEIEAALGARPVAWLLANAPVDSRWCLIHATHMVPEETEGLARSGAIAGLCPITEANLGDGLFDAPRFRAAGGTFGVGSDSNVRVALAEELRTLEYGQRLRDRRRNVFAGNGLSTGRALYEGALAGGARAPS
jgi:formimidoylglutamate deiminase